MNVDALSAMTGLPSGKKSRRGKRSRGKSKPHAEHMQAIQASLDQGDHQGAKVKLLSLANALHKTQKQQQPDVSQLGADPMSY